MISAEAAQPSGEKDNLKPNELSCDEIVVAYIQLFQSYKKSSGQMSFNEYLRVLGYSPTSEELIKAERELSIIAIQMFDSNEMIDIMVIMSAAKMVGALGLEFKSFLLFESMIFAGRD